MECRAVSDTSEMFVRLSVKHLDCDKMKGISVQFFKPYENVYPSFPT